MQNNPLSDEQIEAVQGYLDSKLPEYMCYVPSWDPETGAQVFWFPNAPNHKIRVTWEFFRDCPDYGTALHGLMLAENIQKAGDQPKTFTVRWCRQATLDVQ
jgi:hypothetical protein